jgi:acetyltransferase-like isoleucine patch superfamily enzyme
MAAAAWLLTGARLQCGRVRLSDLAPGLVLGDDVQLGEGVRLGNHVVIHDRTVIGDGCEIGDHVVLGKPRSSPRAPRPQEAPPPLELARA